MRPLSLALTAALLALGPSAFAANYPCSGMKGGVAHCAGERFVCNDGSISASKRSCSAERGGPASGRAPVQQPRGPSAAPGSCSCRSGNVCTGPRGGRYCISDSGRKSYVRQ